MHFSFKSSHFLFFALIEKVPRAVVRPTFTFEKKKAPSTGPAVSRQQMK
jgi:hypothetical protein